jgi:outer membrane biosynthesis protein TonB
MIVVLSSGLAVMLVVVVLRTETTRLHFEVSQRERQSEGFRQQLRESELELARLRNPMLIREQVKEALQEYLQLDAPTTRPAKPEILQQLDQPPAPKPPAKKPPTARDKDRGKTKADKPRESKSPAKPAEQPKKSDKNKRKN